MVHTNNSLEFDVVERALGRADVLSSAAELHGTLIGQICAQGNLDVVKWIAQIVEKPQEDLLAQDARVCLTQLYHNSMADLNSEDFTFELLLPDDDHRIDERAEALGDWCQGFLYGLALGGMADERTLSTDVKELLDDFSEITKIGALEEDEENETAFAELVEFVRVGVLLVYEELQPQKAPSRLQ